MSPGLEREAPGPRVMGSARTQGHGEGTSQRTGRPGVTGDGVPSIGRHPPRQRGAVHASFTFGLRLL